MRRLAVLVTLAACLPATACTSTDPPATSSTKASDKTGAPTPTPDPVPQPERLARAAIASVQMIEDCPNRHDGWRPPPAVTQTTPAPPAAQAIAKDEPPPAPGAPMPGSAARAADSSGHWEPPCSQSTMQVVFSGQGDRTATVAIEAVRLQDPKSGKSLATLAAREPAAWTDGAYQSWNETIGPKQEVKASYALSVPDWSAVEAALGVPSNSGVMFVLEVDVKVGDQTQTVRSPEFPREMPHVIVT